MKADKARAWTTRAARQVGLIASLGWAACGVAHGDGLRCTYGANSLRPCGPTGVVSSNGTIVPANTPSPAPVVNTGRMGGSGPLVSTASTAWRPPTPSNNVGRAPEVQRYQSPACAQLSDAIRTGPARGLRWEAVSQLRDEYRGKCQDDERRAQGDLARDQSQAREVQQAAQVAREREAQDRSRCQELWRILAGKRHRIDTLSEGERKDLQRSEQAYAERCGRV